MESLFKKATRQQAKLRLSIAGPSGSGKTYSALAIGTHLGKVAVLDTEHGSASKYADDPFEFDVLELEAPFHPDRYIKAIEAAAEAGYDVVIVDSLSHAWNGPGGLLEIVDQIAARMKTSNSFAAWKDATPIHNRLIEALISVPIHIIATMRSKQDYVIEEDSRGKKVPRKLGLAPIQRDGMEYEFDVFAEMDMQNRMLIQKTRCSALSGGVFEKPGKDVADILSNWLSGGAPPEPKPKTNGKAKNGQAKKSTKRQKIDAQNKMMSEAQRGHLHALGSEIYGDGWDDKRHELVEAVTKGRTKSSTELSPSEAKQLIDGLLRKQEAAA